MKLTRARVLTLCEMARRGATDDAGREFALAMLEAYQEQWNEHDNNQSKMIEKMLEEKFAKEDKEVVPTDIHPNTKI